MNWKNHLGEWYKIPEIKDLVSSPYMKKVLLYLNKEYNNKIIYPKKQKVFKAFKLCNPDKLKVVILGQDPYHDGSATGLAFANDINKLRLSPSLEKIQDTVETNVYENLNLGFDTTLESWAEQGVLLLNTSLTVQRDQANSHFKVWKRFTSIILDIISENYPGTIFMLWGKQANTYVKGDQYDLRDNCNVLTSIHPAAASYNKVFWECDNFNKANNIIREQNGQEFCIKW